MQGPAISPRRDFLKSAGLGLAASSAGVYRALAQAAEAKSGHPLAPRRSNHPARAKHLIFVFLTGGFSHVDTFDPKPQLAVDAGKSVSAIHLRGTDVLPLMPSPFRFTQHGQSGLPMSELFPHLRTVADELCVVRSLHTDIIEHFQSVLAMHTGSATVPLPSIGAWVSFGLGTLNANLPSYVVFCEHPPYGGSQVWDSNFLPPVHQGVRIFPGPNPLPDLASRAPTLSLHELEQRMLRDANELHAEARPGDLNLRARQTSFDIARGMMRVAPEVFDLAGETRETLDLYGVDSADKTSFAWQCLMARRMVERGVRTVELIDTGASNNWDAHGNMQDHRPKALRVDRALAALIQEHQTARSARRNAGRHLHRVRPHTLDRRPERQGSESLRGRLLLLAGRRGYKRGNDLRADRRTRDHHRGQPSPRARLPRDDPPRPGPRPRASDLPLCRPRFSPHRRPCARRPGHPGLTPRLHCGRLP